MNEETKKESKFMKKVKAFPYGVIPSIIVMSVIVLIIRYYKFNTNMAEYNWYVTDDTSMDLFLYHKSVWLGVLAKVMLAVLVGAVVYGRTFSFHKAMIPLGVYGILVVLSTIFSEYRYFSLEGIDDHFESVYVLLAYCLFVAYTYWFTDSRRAVWVLLAGWFVGIALMGVVGIFQMTKNDLILTDFVQKLILPKEVLAQGGGIGLTFPEGTAYLTVFNPNYVGYYAALAIPVLTVMFLFAKNKIVKIVSLILDVVIFACLLSSGARNGIVAIVIALILLGVMFRSKVKKYWKIFLAIVAVLIAVFVGYDAMNKWTLSGRLLRMFDTAKDDANILQKIETNDENIVITYGEHELTLVAVDNEADGYIRVEATDELGEPVEYETLVESPQSYKITDERFPMNVTVGKIGQCLGFGVDIDGLTWCFSNKTEKAGYFYYNSYGRFTKIEHAEAAVFDEYSWFANGRGYLWARTIPLLKEYFFVGSGPDTFTLVFPQEDYVAASKLGYHKMLVTKPHNLYLQIATQTGVVSLIAFLVFNGIYLIESIRLYWKRKMDDTLECLGVGIMLAIVAYLISGIINDSTICVAPIYWCLMGLGLSVNRIVKKGEQVEIIESDTEEEETEA